jgi:hypothetical protein
VYPVLWENVAGASQEGFINVGYTDHYVRVRALHPRPLTNLITLAQMDTYDADGEQVMVTPLI